LNIKTFCLLPVLSDFYIKNKLNIFVNRIENRVFNKKNTFILRGLYICPQNNSR
jgi:hypothetical protein